MTQDVRQWLAEIKVLQQQLVELRQERDEAYSSAANWRKLYETEAKQRRTEAAIAKQAVEQRQPVPQRQPSPQEPSPGNGWPEVDTLDSLDAAKARLVDALTECARLTQALSHQRAEHAKAKEALTVALADTMQALTQERARQSVDPSHTSVGLSKSADDESKTPSPELPPSDPAKSLA